MDPILDALPCGYVTFKDDTTIESVNLTLSDLLEYRKEELTGKPLDTILTIASRIFYNTHLFPLIKLQSRADEIFVTLLSKSGDHVPVLLNAKRRTMGDVSYNEFVLFKVNERKKYEDEILAAKRAAEEAVEKNESLQSALIQLESQTLMLDHEVSKLSSVNGNLIEFNKIITHDFQESIRKIEMFASKIAVAGQDTAVTKIINSARRLRSLSTTLELFINLQGERLDTMVDLNSVLEEVISEVSDSRDFYEFDVENYSLPMIEGSRHQLKMMFYQLLDNSVIFRNENARLKIGISVTPIQENMYRANSQKYKYVDYIRIAFSDNGRGFDGQYKEYVFGLLKKLDPKSDRLGIGLGLVKKIVDNHSGDVDAESSIGSGATFTITLPREQPGKHLKSAQAS